MKIAVALCLMFASGNLLAQNVEDTKIIIEIEDSVSVYDRAKKALIKNDFIVKDDGNRDTIITYPREFKKMEGFCIAQAVIERNRIILSGVYGTKRITYIGQTISPKSYKPILYFKGGKGWLLLMQIAETIGGTISYSK